METTNYTTIERSFRGFTYAREFQTIKGFWESMRFNVEKESNEIEWAKLFDSETGDECAAYRRGCEIEDS